LEVIFGWLLWTLFVVVVLGSMPSAVQAQQWINLRDTQAE
jgi:hypothetical protein